MNNLAFLQSAPARGVDPFGLNGMYRDTITRGRDWIKTEGSTITSSTALPWVHDRSWRIDYECIDGSLSNIRHSYTGVGTKDVTTLASWTAVGGELIFRRFFEVPVVTLPAVLDGWEGGVYTFSTEYVVLEETSFSVPPSAGIIVALSGHYGAGLLVALAGLQRGPLYREDRVAGSERLKLEVYCGKCVESVRTDYPSLSDAIDDVSRGIEQALDRNHI